MNQEPSLGQYHFKYIWKKIEKHKDIENYLEGFIWFEIYEIEVSAIIMLFLKQLLKYYIQQGKYKTREFEKYYILHSDRNQYQFSTTLGKDPVSYQGANPKK